MILLSFAIYLIHVQRVFKVVSSLEHIRINIGTIYNCFFTFYVVSFLGHVKED